MWAERKVDQCIEKAELVMLTIFDVRRIGEQERQIREIYQKIRS